MDKRAGAGIVILLLLIATTASVIIIKRINRDDEEADQGDQGPVIHEMGVKVLDAFTTDRITSLVTAPMLSMVFLVLELEMQNPLDQNISVLVQMITLRRQGEEIPPSFMDQYVGRSFSKSENISANSNISGYLHFPIFPDDVLLDLYYNDSMYNITFTLDLRNLTLDHRPWSTPLEFRITGCGRDAEGSGRERLLYFLLEVKNPGENATHFMCWLIDLGCRNGVKLDGQFVDQPEDCTFMPGWVRTYKPYFDIPPSSPDEPKVLLQLSEGMSIDVDETLYADLI